MEITEALELLSELESFYKGLRNYKNRQLKRQQDKFSEAQNRSLNAFRLELQREHGRLDEVISKYGGIGYMSGFTRSGGPYMKHEVFSFILVSLDMDSNQLEGLDLAISLVNKAIGKLKSTPLAATELQDISVTEPPKAFIAHGGDSPALSKLKNFLEALGIEPIVVEEQPSEGRSVAENVDWYSRQADCAIILATKGDVDSKTGGFIPRGNVLIEIGKSQEIFKDRIIYLLQAGAHLPTNVSEKVWGRFTTQCMDDAFIKVAIELYKFGLLKSVKHPQE